MARIRSVHPGMFTDEDFMALSPYAMAAWPGIWTEADDQGVFEWKPLTLKARLLPCAQVDMGAILAEYASLDLVRQFDVDGKRYGAIRNFRKFQRPEKPKCWLPLPDEYRDYVALKEDAEDDKITALRKRKVADQDGKCAYCGTEITWHSKRGNSLEIDHVIPISRGGTDDDDNLVASCRACNRAKKDLTGQQFASKLAMSGKIVNTACHRFAIATGGDAGASHCDAAATRGNPPQMEDGIGEGVGRKKEPGGERSESPSRSLRSPPAYAFSGAIIRLTAKDFAAWEQSFWAIPDLRAELTTIDAKLVAEGFEGKWFGRVAAWLRKRHETLLRERPEPAVSEREQWHTRLTVFVDPRRGGPQRQRWVDSAWGPPPGHPGCRAPPELLAEFGIVECVAAD